MSNSLQLNDALDDLRALLRKIERSPHAMFQPGLSSGFYAQATDAIRKQTASIRQQFDSAL